MAVNRIFNDFVKRIALLRNKDGRFQLLKK